MTRDEGVALIHQQLGFRSDLAAEIVANLQLAQTTLELMPTKPWFLTSEDSFAATVIGEERIPIPLDFIQEVEDAVFKYRPDAYPDEDEIDLVKDDYDQLRLNFREEPDGPPAAYALVGEYFRIFPKPDAVYQVRLIYYAKDTVLDTNIENKWLKHVPLLLLGSAGEMMTGGIRDTEASKKFKDWIALGSQILNSHSESRLMANRSNMQVGGPHA